VLLLAQLSNDSITPRIDWETSPRCLTGPLGKSRSPALATVRRLSTASRHGSTASPLPTSFSTCLDVLHGRDEFLSFLQEWTAPYRDWQLSAEELFALDDDVLLGRVRQWGHPHDIERAVVFVWGQIGIWRDGRCVHALNYTTYEEARNAAETLIAERRGG
jgi:hypothetical protein